MRYGVVLPGGTAPEQLDQAVLAEQAGWDAVFTWEAAYGVDAWSLLAAMAVRTLRVRLGTMLTPLPWRSPWKVASQVATLDQLSGGRAILAVGVGAVDTELPDAGGVTDLRGRAERPGGAPGAAPPRRRPGFRHGDGRRAPAARLGPRGGHDPPVGGGGLHLVAG